MSLPNSLFRGTMLTMQAQSQTQNAGPGRAPADARTLLRVDAVSKSFSGFVALNRMSLAVSAGEVHILFGENGAGKSTLINIICGALAPTSGRVLLDGESLNLRSVREARNKGIAAVFQEFSLAPDLSVEDNLFLGVELCRYGKLLKRDMRVKARQLLSELDFPIDPASRVSSLSRAECQMVEIAKAVLTEPRVLIFDEPTASLTESETTVLFDLIARLKVKRVGMIYITHRIDEIGKIGDRVTVMRDGQFIETFDAKIATKTQLVESMTGRKFGDFYPAIHYQPGREILSISNLATIDGRVSDVTLNVREGEIVGLAGLVGCGKSEIGRACFGLEALTRGNIEFCGEALRRPQPRDLIRRGMGFVPSDRIREGLLLDRSTRENLSLAALEGRAFTTRGFLRRRYEKNFAQEMAEKLGVRPLRLEAPVAHYSGGNKQKILLGRSIASPLRLLILDEPTVGIDVGAKAEVYDLLKGLVEMGMAILLISSDLPEVLSLSNRVYVVRHGRISDELTGERKTEDAALGNFFSN